MNGHNAHSSEIAKFEQNASTWWDPAGPFAPLHAINPLRVDYIQRRLGSLNDQRIADIGCGGGILCEALAERGAQVTGIDLAPQSLEVARLHALESGIAVDYQQIAAEDFAAEHAQAFDVVTCLELLEHVPDPQSIVGACAQLVRPGGSVFFSTINRNPRAWLLAIVGAEHILRLLPRGTHDARAFIRPAELAGWARAAGLHSAAMSGLTYNPLTSRYALSDDIRVNYLLHAYRPEDA